MGTGWTVYWEPKLGNAASEYEDAFWPAAGRVGADRFAVADGATESSYSREWAEALVAQYGTRAPWKPNFIRSLPELQDAWRSRRDGASLPWFAEMKIQQGAYAAFLGVRLLPRNGRVRLHALAAGDCELVHLTGGRPHCAFPLRHSREFGIHPELIGTWTDSSAARHMITGRREDVRVGDRLLLMTDALAAWFLREDEDGRRPWETLDSFGGDGQAAFGDWVDSARRTGEMRNDDVTLGVVELT